MHKSRLRFALLTAAFGFAVTSCVDIFTVDPNRDTPRGSLNLVFSYPISTKTIIPGSTALDVSRFEVSGAGPGGETFTMTDVTESESLITDLAAGEWNISVSAYNSDAIEILAGDVPVTIIAGSAVEKGIALVPVNGAGMLNISVTWEADPEASTTLTGTLTDAAGDEQALDFIFDAVAGTASINGLSINSGSYILVLSLVQNAVQVFAYTEAVWILADLTTAIDIPISADYMNTSAQSTVEFVETTGPGTVEYSVDLGNEPKDVIFIFTNTGTGDATVRPEVASASVFMPMSTPPEDAPPSVSGGSSFPLEDYLIMDNQEVARFNAAPFTPADFHVSSARMSTMEVTGGGEDEVNVTADFFGYGEGGILRNIPSTCRLVRGGVPVAGGTRGLSIWVADDSWHAGGTSVELITQTMVDLIADKFLHDDGAAGVYDDDIYDWATNIYDEEWGDHDETSLINCVDHITILLHDIDEDNSTTGGTLGIFSSRNNYLTSVQDKSNERIMFYLDSVLLATADDGQEWQPDDFWPAQIVSTLTHELQHMIQFYQKRVLRVGLTSGTKIWINEMLSLVTEDLLSSKVGISGPRGIPPADGTAGGAGIIGGRLGHFNYWNDAGLTDWPDAGATIDEYRKQYGACYAFGAWLARNYGGAPLFREIVHSSYVNEGAVENALSVLGYGNISFEELLRRWAVSVALSDEIYPPVPDLRYNKDGFFSSSFNGIEYLLGSINLYNYEHNGQVGPLFFDTTPVGHGVQPAASNALFRAGSSLTGVQTWMITLPAQTALTVVLKD